MIIENGVLKCVFESDIKITGNERVVELPAEVVEIGRDVFFGTKISTVVYTENLKKIRDRAFKYSLIEKMYPEGDAKDFLYIAKNIEFVGREAFSGCSKIKGAKLDCKELDTAAFENCEKLGVVYCEENVEKVGHFAFMSCLNLLKFEAKNENIDMGMGPFTFNTKVKIEKAKNKNSTLTK